MKTKQTSKADGSRHLPFSLGDTIELTIDRLSYGGEGVGRFQGVVVFVPFTAPGDVVRAHIYDVKKNFAFGTVVQILKDGPHRETPTCPVYGTCGGCQLQHISYANQLEQKQNILAFEFEKARLSVGDLRPMIPSPKIWNYRNRIQLRVMGDRVGLFKRGSHEIAAIDGCPISDERLNAKIPELKKRPNAKRADGSQVSPSPRQATTLSKVELYLTPGGQVLESSNVDHGEEFGFSQVNESVNQLLIQNVLEHAAEVSWTQCWDLYGGNGNFATPLKMKFSERSVGSVELNKNAVASGRALATEAHVEVEFVEKDVGQFLREFIKARRSCDLMIIDPPRQGMGDRVAKQIAGLNVGRIILIGCDLPHTVRDLKVILSLNRFQIKSVQAFDMFPQTFHFETIVVLDRASPNA